MLAVMLHQLYVSMKIIKFLSILTLIFNALILIGAGHGFGPIILFEFLLFSADFTKGSEINLIGNYDEKLIPFAFLNLIFQLILFSSIFMNQKLKTRIITISVICLILNLIYFTYDFVESNLSRFTLISGIPFIKIGCFLILKINSVKTQLKNE